MTEPTVIERQIESAQAVPLSWPTRFVERIVAILDAEAPKTFKVAPFPDDPKDFDLGEYEGAILVYWKGAKYLARPGAQPASVQREFAIDVAVVARGASGRNGAPEIIERVRLILQNRNILGATPLVPVDDGITGQTEHVYRYDITFKAQAPAVGGNWPHPSEEPR